ncbi:pilus assembly protein PilP [Amphibiibacter pelophylacis]|uniref:Pilus assembly protein PilP n=1 Tax=Amphibiibacter pelophylacis TaxID=1799477 RepID=A0ACC6P478_9BURK
MTQSPLKPLLSALSVLAALALTGCDSASDDLNAWTRQEFDAVKPRIEPLNPPRRFVPQQYSNTDGVSPFDVGRVFPQDPRSEGPSDPLVQAELRRPRQALEGFGLDQITMVGSLMRGGKRYALVQAGGLIYTVEPGQYLGENFGKITEVSETKITLRELVQSDQQSWTQRTATLALQEK